MIPMRATESVSCLSGFEHYVTSETKRNQNQHGEVICYTHTSYMYMTYSPFWSFVFGPQSKPKISKFQRP